MAGRSTPAADRAPLLTEPVRCGGYILTEAGWQIDEPAAPTDPTTKDD
jgi:hypothetical protein